MKFNLKNRPIKPEFALANDTSWLLASRIWFEGFEKELRERILQQDLALKKVPKKLRSKFHTITIEEILG